jgi:glutamate dehydrogenase/leucine dehydrogenase
VIDNVLAGPAIGGVRLAPEGGVEECVRLARAMTLKSAAAGLPHGGGKAIVLADLRAPLEVRERLLRAFARAIARYTEYIPGPDMGTDERAMAWIKSEIGRAIGLPAEQGGIPLDEIGATGLGVAVAAEIAARHIGLDLAGARVAIQGFGAVGRSAARFLTERGARIVAVADVSGCLVAEAGLDVAALLRHTATSGLIEGFGARPLRPRDEIVGVPCEIWIPAARPDAIHDGNVDHLDTRLIVQGANIPVTAVAEAKLHGRGIVSVPDFIANAGGLICGAVEVRGGTVSEALTLVRIKVAENTTLALHESAMRSITPRQAAVAMAEQRLRELAARRSQVTLVAA